MFSVSLRSLVSLRETLTRDFGVSHKDAKYRKDANPSSPEAPEFV